MPITVPDDAYTSVEDADTLIADTVLAADWAALETSAKEAKLRQGKRAMDDNVSYPGDPTVPGQPWPRRGVALRHGAGRYLSETAIPSEIAEANALQAAAMTAGDRESDDVVETLGIAAASGTAFTGRGGRKVIADAVRDLLHASGYGRVRTTGTVRAVGVVRG